MKWFRCEAWYVLAWVMIGLGKVSQYLLRSETLSIYAYDKAVHLANRAYENAVE